MAAAAEREREAEALRLKALAEKKFPTSVKSALKLAERAHEVKPDLPGLNQLLTTFRIVADHRSAAPDLYKILHLRPSAHATTVSRQYKRLAPVLHPSNNPSPGAYLAFDALSLAFLTLSDSSRRKTYDQSRPSATSSSFWTACSTCRLYHEFDRRHLGRRLVCPSCSKPFLASEVRSPNDDHDGDADDEIKGRSRTRAGGGGSGKPSETKIKTKSFVYERRRDSTLKAKSDGADGAGTSSRGQSGASVAAQSSEQANPRTSNLRAKEKGKIRHDDGDDVDCGVRGGCDDGTRVEAASSGSSDKQTKRKPERALGMKLRTRKGKADDDGGESRDDKAIVVPLQKKARPQRSAGRPAALRKKARLKSRNVGGSDDDEWVPDGEDNVEENEDDDDDVLLIQMIPSEKKCREKRKISDDADKGERKGEETLADFQLAVKRKLEMKKVKKEKVNEKEITLASGGLHFMIVEDADLYDFDKDRVERSFKKGQVWAVYDDDDGMPRHYGLVDELVSVNPFLLKISWLDLQDTGDEKLICLGNASVHISCGRFKVGKMADIDSLNCFSHLVECERAAREIYRIFPKKGSVWALYAEDVNGELGSTSPNDKRCYDIVVFLTSYSEMHGLSMAYLDKVEGFKTIFKRREYGCHAISWLEKDDIELCSHQIPARKITGEEASNLPEDCWELDPASLPSDLTRVGWKR